MNVHSIPAYAPQVLQNHPAGSPPVPRNADTAAAGAITRADKAQPPAMPPVTNSQGQVVGRIVNVTA